MIYKDRDGNEWSIDKGDWKSHQKTEKENTKKKKNSIKTLSIVAGSLFFVVLLYYFI